MFDPPDARSQGGGCKTRWQVPTGRSFVIKQNNGWTTSCNLIASNPGPHTITYAGEPSCDARGTNNVGQMNSRKVRGTIINNQFRLQVDWTNGNIGTYTATIDGAGILHHGSANPKAGAQAGWKVDGALECAAR